MWEKEKQERLGWRSGEGLRGARGAGMRREMHSRVFMSPSGSPPSLGATRYAVRALAFFRASGGKRSGRFIREGEVLRQRSNKRPEASKTVHENGLVLFTLFSTPRMGYAGHSKIIPQCNHRRGDEETCARYHARTHVVRREDDIQHFGCPGTNSEAQGACFLVDPVMLPEFLQTKMDGIPPL